MFELCVCKLAFHRFGDRRPVLAQNRTAQLAVVLIVCLAELEEGEDARPARHLREHLDDGTAVQKKSELAV
eukprot:6719567-Prymnesium_polylepis.1